MSNSNPIPTLPDEIPPIPKADAENPFKDILLPQLLVVAVFAVCFILLIYFPTLDGAVSWKPFTETNIGGSLSSLVFISLALQSSLEVFVNNFRKPGKAERKREVDVFTKKVAYFLDEMEAAGDRDTTEINQKLLQAEAGLKVAVANLENFRHDTGKITSIVAIFAGLVIADAGVRVLDPFVNSLSGDQLQEDLFHTCDIILTAALIAGGSRGIDRLTDLYESFTGSATTQAAQAGNSK